EADAVRRLILAGGEVGRFHDPARPFLHPEDVEIALDVDRYDFAVRVKFEDGRPVARIQKPAQFTNLAGEGEFLFRDRSAICVQGPGERGSDLLAKTERCYSATPLRSLPVTRAIGITVEGLADVGC